MQTMPFCSAQHFLNNALFEQHVILTKQNTTLHTIQVKIIQST